MHGISGNIHKKLFVMVVFGVENRMIHGQVRVKYFVSHYYVYVLLHGQAIQDGCSLALCPSSAQPGPASLT